MPKLYLTPNELTDSPLGQNSAVSAIIAALAPGAIDKILFRCSKRCDTFTDRRLQGPQNTTLSMNVSAGATQIAVASTLSFDELAEQGLIIGTGASTEIVDIAPGGITVTSFTSPYPGVITLLEPLTNAHSIGETVQGVLREVSEVGGSSSSDVYSEQMMLMSQDAQIAIAHLPPIRMALSRVVLTKNYPIQSVFAIDHSYSYNNTFHSVNTTIESISSNQGWYKFNVGAVILEQGLIRTTYKAGMQTIEDDIKLAVGFYLRDELSSYVNPFGVEEERMNKRSMKWNFQKKSANVMQAEEILTKYRSLT